MSFNLDVSWWCFLRIIIRILYDTIVYCMFLVSNSLPNSFFFVSHSSTPRTYPPWGYHASWSPDLSILQRLESVEPQRLGAEAWEAAPELPGAFLDRSETWQYVAGSISTKAGDVLFHYIFGGSWSSYWVHIILLRCRMGIWKTCWKRRDSSALIWNWWLHMTGWIS